MRRSVANLLRGEPCLREVQHLAVPDAERLDPALLAECQRGEVTELDDLLLGEVPAQALPRPVVRLPRTPDQAARVRERGLLPVVVALRALELEQLVEVPFG